MNYMQAPPCPGDSGLWVSGLHALDFMRVVLNSTVDGRQNPRMLTVCRGRVKSSHFINNRQPITAVGVNPFCVGVL